MPATWTVTIVLILIVCGTKSENDQDEEFVATKEWKVVKKGQSIPRGLHVRINLETGVTEAKLLEDDTEDPNSSKTKALLEVPQDNAPLDQDEPMESKMFTKLHMQEAIKNIPSDDALNLDTSEIKKIKDRFRSYNEIKKTLKDLNMTPKLDAEVIALLLEKHRDILGQDKPDKPELLRLLEDLDFLAHQHDNALEFVQQGGFKNVIYKNLNSTDAEIKRETLRLFSSLVQNNNKPKIHALETGAVAFLLRLITFDSDYTVKLRGVTALSSLLRSFPAAQRNFIDNGGFSVISKFFEKDDTKMQLKLATFVSDLIIEHNWARLDESLSKYYSHFNLSTIVFEHNWCDNLNKLLHALLVVDIEDHDSIEKCLIAMHSLRKKCGSEYERNVLLNVQKRYEKLSTQESASDEDSSSVAFFSGMKDICQEILFYVKESSVKTEL